MVLALLLHLLLVLVLLGMMRRWLLVWMVLLLMVHAGKWLRKPLRPLRRVLHEFLEIVWCGEPALLFRCFKKRKKSPALLFFGCTGGRLPLGGFGLGCRVRRMKRLGLSWIVWRRRRMGRLGLDCVVRRRRRPRGTRCRVLRVLRHRHRRGALCRVLRVRCSRIVRRGRRLRRALRPVYQGRRLGVCPRQLLRLLRRVRRVLVLCLRAIWRLLVVCVSGAGERRRCCSIMESAGTDGTAAAMRSGRHARRTTQGGSPP